ncbi:MAG: hypothetical protein RLZZ368_1286, partial [Actinomycetota bacterium]
MAVDRAKAFRRSPNYHSHVTLAPTSRADLDPYRLPRHVLPRRYEVTLDPNLDAATFGGHVVVHAEALATTRLIAINAKDLDIESVFVDGSPAVHVLDVESER